MNKLYSISICSSSWNVEHLLEVDKSLGLHGDWLRFSAFQWLLYSPHNKQQIVTTLTPKLRENDQLIVLTIQPEYAEGITHPWIWNWLNDKMLQILSPP